MDSGLQVGFGVRRADTLGISFKRRKIYLTLLPDGLCETINKVLGRVSPRRKTFRIASSRFCNLAG